MNEHDDSAVVVTTTNLTRETTSFQGEINLCVTSQKKNSHHSQKRCLWSTHMTTTTQNRGVFMSLFWFRSINQRNLAISILDCVRLHHHQTCHVRDGNVAHVSVYFHPHVYSLCALIPLLSLHDVVFEASGRIRNRWKITLIIIFWNKKVDKMPALVRNISSLSINTTSSVCRLVTVCDKFKS